MTVISELASEPFGQWLRGAMTRNGYPADGPRAGGLKLLAERSGVSQPSISRALAGATPDLDTLRALAPALDVSLKELLIRSGRVSPEELADAADMPPLRPPLPEQLPEGWQRARAIVLLPPGSEDVRRRVSLPVDAVRLDDGWAVTLHGERQTAYPACRVAEVDIEQPL